MGTESSGKAIPKIAKRNAALKLAQTWVDKMSPTAEEGIQVELTGRPPRLGLGAKETPFTRATAPTDPLERALLGKLKAAKKPSSKDFRKDSLAEESESSGDDDEPQSRTVAVAKKRAMPPVATPKAKKNK